MKKSGLLLLSMMFVMLFSGCVTSGDTAINAQIGLAGQIIKSTEDIKLANSLGDLVVQGSKQLEVPLGKANVTAFDKEALLTAINDSKDEHESLSFFGDKAKGIVSKIPYGDWALKIFLLLFGSGGLATGLFANKKAQATYLGAEDMFEAIEDKDLAKGLKVIMATRHDAMGVGKQVKADLEKLKKNGIMKPSKK